MLCYILVVVKILGASRNFLGSDTTGKDLCGKICGHFGYIQGARFFGTEDTNSLSTVPVQQPASEVMIENGTSLAATSSGTTFRAHFVGQGYKQVCGQADVWGDGVVPEVSAHLEGALNISLDRVYDSPVGSDDESRPWYCSPSVGDEWLNHLLH